MPIRTWFRYALLPLIHPHRRLEELLEDKHHLAYSASMILAIGVLYTITVAVGYRNGFGAAVTPWLNIPASEYYFWEQFFVIPVFFLGVIVFAGTARLLAARLGGSGTFELDISLYSAALVLPTLLTMWLPETLLIVFFPDARLTPLGGFAVIPPWLDAVRQIGGALWTMIIAGMGLCRAEQLGWLKAVLIMLLAMIPTVMMTLVFVR